MHTPGEDNCGGDSLYWQKKQKKPGRNADGNVSWSVGYRRATAYDGIALHGRRLYVAVDEHHQGESTEGTRGGGPLERGHHIELEDAV